jgi:hypothetical protein
MTFMPYRNRLTALLSLGYFPKELPPVFKTSDFGKHAHDIIEEWRAGSVFKTETCSFKPQGKPKANLAGSYIYKLADAEIEIISKPKRGYERRNVHITHPIPQALLAYEISKNWSSVRSWLLRQRYSLDEIRISQTYDRSIKGINFLNHRAKKEYIAATSDWLVKTDITRFYPSLYTHSIAWAAYGKKNVKSRLNLYKGSLADRIDILVRACNRNQTIGIPIGPETSRIIAETISSRIDMDFYKFNEDISRDSIDRLQDDWVVGVETLERAEHVLSQISSIYREFGLEINGSKTSIDRIIALSGTSWISELSSFLSHRSEPLKGARLREFLFLSLRLQASHLSEPVINYAMSVIEGKKFYEGDIESLESFLLKAAVLAPISLDKICRVIINIDNDTHKLSKGRIISRFRILAERSIERGNTFEAIWLIYTIRGLHGKLNSKRISDLMLDHHGSTLPLILLDMQNSGLFTQKLPKEHWEELMNKERINSDWVWLLAYEGIRKGWISDKKKILSTPFFKAMHSRDVVFYDQKANIKTSRKAIIERKEAWKANMGETKALLKALRGIKNVDIDDMY